MERSTSSPWCSSKWMRSMIRLGSMLMSQGALRSRKASTRSSALVSLGKSLVHLCGFSDPVQGEEPLTLDHPLVFSGY